MERVLRRKASQRPGSEIAVRAHMVALRDGPMVVAGVTSNETVQQSLAVRSTEVGGLEAVETPALDRKTKLLLHFTRQCAMPKRSRDGTLIKSGLTGMALYVTVASRMRARGYSDATPINIELWLDMYDHSGRDE